jgi:hypothetical protein
MKTVIKRSIGRPFLRSSLILIALALGFVALGPRARAVVPAPDGGYPGGNTAEGQSALLSLTTGTYNTAVGLFSLRSDTTGSFNTAIGAGALLANTGSQNGPGTQNTAVGAGALLSNTTGAFNTANGAFALFSNTTGSNNTANGLYALLSNTTGGRNTANGTGALDRNTTGVGNTAVGFQALFSNTTGNDNTANGTGAFFSNTTGGNNTAVGVGALAGNIDQNDNTAIGYHALSVNTGAGNLAIGSGALDSNTSGSFNVAINGGHNLTTGIFNIAIANDGVAGESNTTRIGILQNRCFISGIRDVTTGVFDAVNVVIDSAGQLGTVSSSRRFKDEIKPMDQDSEAILCLKPVTFHYKSDHTARPQCGLIAEEVAAVNPDLVVRDKNGEIYTVRYDQVNAMLLNEFLKEHRKVQDLEKGVAAITAQLKEQAAQIQKVSAHLEMSKPATNVVLNNP